MKVNLLEVSSPRKQSALASVKVELADAEGNVVTIDDLRVLRNRQGQLCRKQQSCRGSRRERNEGAGHANHHQGNSSAT
jgi:hypothetical protein